MAAWRLERVLSPPRIDQDAFRAAMEQGGVEGVLFALEAFGTVYEPRDTYNPLGRGMALVPFVLWPFQERAVRLIYAGIIEGHDVLVEKSRDMGATWLTLGVFWALWLTQPELSLSVMSRKEEYVDRSGDPKTLFWKLDWLNRWLPPWLAPKVERNHMHLRNLENGSTIDGESANSDAGRGGRGQAMLIDEAAFIDNMDQVRAATADTTPCRVFISTPNGAGSYDQGGTLHGNCFGALRFSNKVEVVSLHWSEHPLKGRDKKRVVRGGKLAWTSPWYEAECHRRASKKEIAQEIDINYLGSGDQFYDSEVLARIRTDELLPSRYTGEVEFATTTIKDGQAYSIRRTTWATSPAGRLQVWGELGPDDKGLPCLRQDHNYAVGCDIGFGTGASNSSLIGLDVDSGEQVLEWACPHTSPEAFARVAAAICLWLRGQNGHPYLGWEANGPGEIFSRELWRLQYRWVLGNIDTSIPWEPQNDKVGWHSNRAAKLRLFGDLRAASAKGEIVIRSSALLGEMEQTVHYPTGGVGPSHLVQETEGAREAHGDRCVAAAVAWLAAKEQPKARFEPPEMPFGSFEQRLQDRTRRKQLQKRGSRW